MIKKYILTLKHDEGEVEITTTASSKEAAIKSVCDAEHAPESAVIKVVEKSLYEAMKELVEEETTEVTINSVVITGCEGPNDDNRFPFGKEISLEEAQELINKEDYARYASGKIGIDKCFIKLKFTVNGEEKEIKDYLTYSDNLRIDLGDGAKYGDIQVSIIEHLIALLDGAGLKNIVVTNKPIPYKKDEYEKEFGTQEENIEKYIADHKVELPTGQDYSKKSIADIAVGDIFYDSEYSDYSRSYYYDFYRVTKKTAKNIWLEPLKKEKIEVPIHGDGRIDYAMYEFPSEEVNTERLEKTPYGFDFSKPFRLTDKYTNTLRAEQGSGYGKVEVFPWKGQALKEDFEMKNYFARINEAIDTVCAINESEDDDKFNYMMLDRLKQDCEYYLGFGNRNEKQLWAGNVKDQIAEMRKIYDKLPEKPEWISLEDIDKYEKEMLSKDETVNEAEDIVYELENRKTGHTIWSHKKTMPGYKFTGRQTSNTSNWNAKGDVPCTESLNEEKEKLDIRELIEGYNFSIIKTRVPEQEILKKANYDKDLFDCEDFEEEVGKPCFVLYDNMKYEIRDIYLGETLTPQISIDIADNLSAFINDSIWEDVVDNFIPKEDRAEIHNFPELFEYLKSHDTEVSEWETTVVEMLATGNKDLFKEITDIKEEDFKEAFGIHESLKENKQAKLFKKNDKIIFNTHGQDSELNCRSGQKATVLRPLTDEEVDIEDVGNMYKIKFEDGYERDAFEDELKLDESLNEDIPSLNDIEFLEEDPLYDGECYPKRLPHDEENKYYVAMGYKDYRNSEDGKLVKATPDFEKSTGLVKIPYSEFKDGFGMAYQDSFDEAPDVETIDMYCLGYAVYFKEVVDEKELLLNFTVLADVEDHHLEYDVTGKWIPPKSLNESLNEEDTLKKIADEVKAEIEKIYADDKDLLEYFYVESGVK